MAVSDRVMRHLHKAQAGGQLPAEERTPATFLPEPEPRPRHYTIISVDDHLIEPPDLFEGRMPAALVDAAPRLVEFENGKQAWAYEDKLFPNIGLNAVVGRPKD